MEDQQQLKRRSTNHTPLDNESNKNDANNNGQKPAAKKARHIVNNKRSNGKGNQHSSDVTEENENPSNPVHIITIDYENIPLDDDDQDDTPHTSSSSSLPSISLTPKLEDLIYPMTSTEFFSSILRKKALHVTCRSGLEDQHASKRLSSDLLQNMFHLDSNKLFHETSSDNIFLWIHDNNNNNNGTDNNGNGNRTNNKKSQHNDHTIRSIEISDPEQANILHSIGGHASYCRAPPIVEQNLVSSLLKETGLGCGQYDPSGESLVSMGRGEVETFISTKIGQTTNWHYDFQENFTIQLSGIKKWTIQQGTIQDPIRGCTPHYGEVPGTVESQLKAGHIFDTKFQFGFPQTGITSTGMIRSIFVKPGDVFYFPAGMWHKVETIEPGVSINVSLMAANYASVTCQALQQLLYKSDKRWLEPVRNNALHNPIEHLKTLLKELPSIIDRYENPPPREGRTSSTIGGLARFIIPPIVEYPPNFQSIEGREEEKEEEEEDVDAVEEEDEEVEESLDEERDKNEDDEIIDPAEFDGYPSNWDVGFRVGDKIKLSINPLASLHKLSEVTSFYKRKNDDSDDNDSCRRREDAKKHVGINHDEDINNGNRNRSNAVYVLNVNYAGNELHQSVVRVVFLDGDDGYVKSLYDLERKEGPVNQVFDLAVSEDNVHHVKFLIFHGYLHVVK